MNEKAVLQEFKDAEAILSGHFILSSGMHSDTYMQCARALIDPQRAARLVDALANKVRAEQAKAFDMVIAPAMGGLIIGCKLAEALNLPFMFVERVSEVFQLRRGFAIEEGARILVCEDVVTTGLSSRETFEALRALGGVIAGEAALVNRTPDNIKDIDGVPLTTLLSIEADVFSADAIPARLADIPAVKPGSRNIKSLL